MRPRVACGIVDVRDMRGEMRSDPQRHHPGALARLALIAFGVIVFTILITGLYVRRADGEYDRITAEILQEAAE